jgi:DNA-binding transcriptional ArsR family regulator
MLDTILGSPTAMRVFLHLHHYGKTYASAIAHDFEISVSQVQKQLERYERAGILVSEKLGNTRIYQYNLKNFLTRPFMELIKHFYDALPSEEKNKFLQIRRRPRKPGKKVKVSVKPETNDH